MELQISRCNPNSGKSTDIILGGYQVKEILNLIIVKSSSSRDNLSIAIFLTFKILALPRQIV
jgi:hypothetical protein